MVRFLTPFFIIIHWTANKGTAFLLMSVLRKEQKETMHPIRFLLITRPIFNASLCKPTSDSLRRWGTKVWFIFNSPWYLQTYRFFKFYIIHLGKMIILNSDFKKIFFLIHYHIMWVMCKTIFLEFFFKLTGGKKRGAGRSQWVRLLLMY